MNVNFLKSQKMPNVIKMRGSGSNGFQRKNSKVGKHDWHLDPFGGHSSPFVVIETDIFTIRTPPRDQKRAKFYNLVRTISKAIKPDYVKVNDERDTFMSKLEGLVLDYRPWNHVEPFLSTSVAPWRVLNRISVFMVAFPLLQFAICYIGAYLSQNALYKFLEEDMDQAHGQNSYVSDWKTYNNPSYLYV